MEFNSESNMPVSFNTEKPILASVNTDQPSLGNRLNQRIFTLEMRYDAAPATSLIVFHQLRLDANQERKHLIESRARIAWKEFRELERRLKVLEESLQRASKDLIEKTWDPRDLSGPVSPGYQLERLIEQLESGQFASQNPEDTLTRVLLIREDLDALEGFMAQPELRQRLDRTEERLPARTNLAGNNGSIRAWLQRKFQPRRFSSQKEEGGAQKVKTKLKW
jgi:hypothetical protein